LILKTSAQQTLKPMADSFTERRYRYGKFKFNINNDIFNFIHNKKWLLP